MLGALLGGDTRTWLVGGLRYGAEGRRRGTPMPGLFIRYAGQRLFRVPVVGPVLGWLNALLRLPSSLRHFRALAQLDAERARTALDHLAAAVETQRQQAQRDRARADEMLAVLRRDLDEEAGSRASADERFVSLGIRLDELAERLRSLAAAVESQAQQVVDDRQRIGSLDRGAIELTEQLRQLTEEAGTRAREALADRELLQRHDARLAEIARDVEQARRDLRTDRDEWSSSIPALRSRLDGLFPPPLDDVHEVRGPALAPLARQRFGIAAGVPLSTLSSHERYALFETVFYESPAVAAKQRAYLPYLERKPGPRLPFLDLGCGRGEFLHILRELGFASVGVDVNPVVIARLRAEGFDVVAQDLIAFLEADRRSYAGASLLQVVEHLTDTQIERMLSLLAPRLVPGAMLIVETPNPLCSLSLALFHTDATHVRPLPPERMRFEIEAAGFEDARTLFQGRIPGDQFAGPDPRAHYVDYAVVARRSAS